MLFKALRIRSGPDLYSRCSPSIKSPFQMYRELSLLSRHVSRVNDSRNIILTPEFLPH